MKSGFCTCAITFQMQSTFDGGGGGGGGGSKSARNIISTKVFFSTNLKRGQENIETFSERLFGWCIAEKSGKPAFYRPQNTTI
jgi:hypothetical protein